MKKMRVMVVVATVALFAIGGKTMAYAPSPLVYAETSVKTDNITVQTPKEQALEMLEQAELSTEDMNALLQFLPFGTATEMSKRLGSATKEEYVRMFIEEIPGFAENFISYLKSKATSASGTIVSQNKSSRLSRKSDILIWEKQYLSC